MPSSNTPTIGNIGSIEKNLWQNVKDHYRLVVMGAAEVGKTAIVQRFLYDHYPGEYKPTVEELYRGEFDVGKSGLVLDILDTSGCYEFPAMRKLAVNTADAFVLVYSIDDEESFEQVRRLKEMLLESKPQGIPVVVVGNKCDLENQRVVKKEFAEIIVNLDWENSFVEASAKNDSNILRIFKEVLVQAKFPFDLNPALQRRRTSLPLSKPIPGAITLKYKQKQKRNSCAVS